MAAMNVSLRPMTEGEFRKYSLFSYENYVFDLARESNRLIADIKAEVGPPPSKMNTNNLWYTVIIGGQRIGFVWLRLNAEKNEAFGMDIWIEEKSRDQGIGRQIMMQAKEMLKDKGIKILRIAFFDSNARSKHLYTSMGFRIDAAIDPKFRTRTADIAL